MHLCARFHSGFGLIFGFYGATFRKKFFYYENVKTYIIFTDFDPRMYPLIFLKKSSKSNTFLQNKKLMPLSFETD